MLKMSATSSGVRFYALKRLLGEFLKYRTTIAIILLLGLVVAAIQPACLAVIRRVIDELQNKGSSSFFNWVPVFLMGVFIVSGLAKYFNNSLRRTLNEKVVVGLRHELFSKYLSFPLETLDQKRTGDMLSSLQNDLAQINLGIDTVCDFLKEPLIFIGLVATAIYLDWKLTISALLVAPLVAWIFSRSGAAVKRYSTKNMEQFSEITSLSQEAISGSRIVKIFQMEGTLLKKFHSLQQSYLNTIIKSIRIHELGTPLVEFIGACLMSVVILYGRSRAMRGDITTGTLITFILDIGLLQMPLKQMNNAYLKIKNAEAAADRIYAVLDAQDKQPLGVRKWPSFTKGIVYDGVTLKYADKLALSNISFEMSQGECVAFVGASGSGKSSIVNLLPRLYEVTQGSILVDGIEIKEICLSDLRRQISVVTQDVFLFNDSVFENIRYGNPRASSTAVRQAAQLAHCMPFIERLSKGFETRVGERGVCLSGGERQRLAIARALIKSAPILILDEATSSLDSHSEEAVQEALETLMEGKTTLLVAHRFSTIRHADRIYVIDSGTIKECGSHDTLVQEQGLYARLYRAQSGVIDIMTQ